MENLHFPDFSQWQNEQVFIVALTLAIVASLETLLCLEATDQLDPKKRVSSANRELCAQGAGNIVSSLLGGLPITQVIVRSSANIQSGGKTRKSAFMHGVLLLVCTVFFSHYINLIPLASLASILMLVGYKLASPSIFKEMYRQGWSQLMPFLATVFGILFTDLLTGIAIGFVISLAHIIWVNYMTPFRCQTFQDNDKKKVKVSLAEYVSFLSKVSVLNLLRSLPEGSKVEIDASKSSFIHPDVYLAINKFIDQENKNNLIIEVIKEESSSLAHDTLIAAKS